MTSKEIWEGWTQHIDWTMISVIVLLKFLGNFMEIFFNCNSKSFECNYNVYLIKNNQSWKRLRCAVVAIVLKNQLKKIIHNGILSFETKDTLNVRVVDHDVGHSEIFKLSNLPIFPRMVWVEYSRFKIWCNWGEHCGYEYHQTYGR